MFGLPSIRIGSIFGIPIEINMSWLLVFVLISFSLAFGYFPLVFGGYSSWVYVLVGSVTAALFFASIVVHEVAHSVVARSWGIPVQKVTLFIFGGVSQIEEEPGSAGREFGMAVAGPGASLVLSAVFYLAFTLASALGLRPWLVAPLEYLSIINLAVAVFNLLPAYPLDGGRVFHSILWRLSGSRSRATRWSARTGQSFGFVLLGLAFVQVAAGRFVNGVWMGMLGWFLISLAGQAYQRQVIADELQSVTVGEVMARDPRVAPAEISLETLAHEYFLGGHHSRYPVVENGEVVGMISLRRARQTPRDRWAGVTVSEVVDRDVAALVVDVATPADDALPKLLGSPDGALLAVDNGHLVGIVTRADIVSLLERHRALAG